MSDTNTFKRGKASLLYFALRSATERQCEGRIQSRYKEEFTHVVRVPSFWMTDMIHPGIDDISVKSVDRCSSQIILFSCSLLGGVGALPSTLNYSKAFLIDSNRRSQGENFMMIVFRLKKFFASLFWDF